MFKYVAYDRVDLGDTVLEFKAKDESVIVHNFDSVVSLSANEEIAIDYLVTSQDMRINCRYITHEEFVELVKNSDRLNTIRDVVKREIAKRYSIADEIAMMKRGTEDVKRLDYESYVAECIALGDELKAEIGY